MKTLSALLLAISDIISSSFCNAQTMLEMKDDSGNKYKQADAEMTRIYKLQEKLATMPVKKD